MKHSLLLMLLLGTIQLTAQVDATSESHELTLQEAIDYGLENNYQAINARREIAKALKQKWETTATGLPQIDGSAGYNYNIEIPVTPLPARIVDPMAPEGQFVGVEFATRQTANLNATLNQLIFDGSYLVALEASKTFLEFSQNSNSKTKLEVRKGIINAYGGVLLTQENIAIIESNLEVLQKNVDETTAIFENGLAEEEDVEQLKITLLQIKNQLANAQRQEQIAMDMLKLALGMPLDHVLILEEELTALAMENLNLEVAGETLQMDMNLDYRIARNFSEQRRLEYKLEQSKALPRLSAFINYGVNAFDEDFVFLDSGTQWFDQSTVGVNLTVPLFSSFGRKAAQDRTRLAWNQAETDLQRVQEEVRLQYESAVNQYQNAVDGYTTSSDNLRLAQRIENKNQIKFKEGLATSFELRQAQTQLYATQSQYLQSLYSLITEKANIETIRNTPGYIKDTK
ncbi:MAG: TolC family protein [Nonlabens sp.]